MNQKFGLKGYILNNKFYLEIIKRFGAIYKKEISQTPISIMHLFLPLHHAFFPVHYRLKGPFSSILLSPWKNLHSSFLCHIHVSMYFLVCCRRLQPNYFQFSLSFFLTLPVFQWSIYWDIKYIRVFYGEILCVCACVHIL